MTGGAGFIGSHLVDALLERGLSVTVFDDLSTGYLENLRQWVGKPRFKFTQVNLSELNYKEVAADAPQLVFHFAADPEVRRAEANPREYAVRHLRMNQRVADFAIHSQSSTIIFASTAAVYGDASVIPTPVTYEPLMPVSNYGVVKLEFERFLQKLCSDGKIRGLILRYANIVGPRCRHGVVYDLLNRLATKPRKLEVLGDGNQRRSFLYVDDCISSTLLSLTKLLTSSDPSRIFNIGNLDSIRTAEVARIITEGAGRGNLDVVFKPATPDGRGWKGDLKQIQLDIKEILQLGWKPSHTSKEALKLTTEALLHSVSNDIILQHDGRF